MIRGRTYYQILQVDQRAETEIINLVYRRLAQRYHPDRDTSDQARERMLEINQAWDVLKDATRRAAYDAELSQRRDRRNLDKYVRRPTDGGVREPAYGEAGIPTGPATGTIVTFGRYRGWTLSQIARRDRDFLEWLEGHPSGRQYRDEIGVLLGHQPGRGRP